MVSQESDYGFSCSHLLCFPRWWEVSIMDSSNIIAYSHFQHVIFMVEVILGIPDLNFITGLPEPDS